MGKSVLVITHQRGFEADPVMDGLRKQGVEVFRFNSDAGADASLASFVSRTGECEFVCDERRIKSAEIGVGWCQQLPPYIGQAADERQCLQRENLLTLQLAALDLLSIRWFNKPRHVLYASNKINQLVTARGVGLNVPQTLVSNDPSVIRAFAKGKTLVAKNLATPWIISGERTNAAYTRIIKPSWLSDDRALSFAPIIYQEFFERKRDIRVVVLGEKLFSGSCVPRNGQREDIRKEGGTGEAFERCDFDADVLKKLRSLMQTLSLDYCAADFMEDREGNLFFLEVNTCGAWWWLDRLYDGAICRSLVEELL